MYNMYIVYKKVLQHQIWSVVLKNLLITFYQKAYFIFYTKYKHLSILHIKMPITKVPKNMLKAF